MMTEIEFVVFFVVLAALGSLCGGLVLVFRRRLIPHVHRASLMLNSRATVDQARAAVEAVGVGLAAGGLVSIVVVLLLALLF